MEYNFKIEIAIVEKANSNQFNYDYCSTTNYLGKLEGTTVPRGNLRTYSLLATIGRLSSALGKQIQLPVVTPPCLSFLTP